jgi:hypothetical protein
MTKVSDLTAITGAAVDGAADLIPIVDMSLAGTARNKKILVNELKEAIAPGTAAALDVDVDDTLAADSDSLIPTQQAVKAYVDANVGTPITELDDVPDVNAPTPSDGDVLTWDSTPGEWVATAPSGGIAELDDVPDVNAPTPSNGDVLTWDSTPGEWVAAAPTGGSADGNLIGIQTITATGAGTYTPTAGTASIVIELVGGGGGGGAVASPTGSNGAFGIGGGGGGYLRKRLTTAFSGAGYVVGAKGTGGTAGNNNGTIGSDTTFTATGGGGTVYTAAGGLAGTSEAAGAVPRRSGAVAGGAATNGDINVSGGQSKRGLFVSTAIGIGSEGGNGPYAMINASNSVNAVNTSQAGANATGYGGGGNGAIAVGTGAAVAGGNGSDGMIIIWEYS